MITQRQVLPFSTCPTTTTVDRRVPLTLHAPQDMTAVMKKIILRLILASGFLIACVFGSAGRWDLPFAWALIGLVFASMVTTACVADKGLLRERAKPAPGGVDRKMPLVMLPFYLGHFIVAGLDVGRYQWSGQIPVGFQIAGLCILACSMAVSLWAVSVNCFFSPVVRVQSERGHHVVKAGPYRWVRHPGYAAALTSILCSGPALGSWWAMLVLAPVCVIALRRAVIEDRYLHEHLEGYVEYASEVRYRLVPGIW
jgi:protein-S-isoprenylcysteine O-methyltransferase Ste14